MFISAYLIEHNPKSKVKINKKVIFINSEDEIIQKDKCVFQTIYYAVKGAEGRDCPSKTRPVLKLKSNIFMSEEAADKEFEKRNLFLENFKVVKYRDFKKKVEFGKEITEYGKGQFVILNLLQYGKTNNLPSIGNIFESYIFEGAAYPLVTRNTEIKGIDYDFSIPKIEELTGFPIGFLVSNFKLDFLAQVYKNKVFNFVFLVYIIHLLTENGFEVSVDDFLIY